MRISILKKVGLSQHMGICKSYIGEMKKSVDGIILAWMRMK